MCAIYKCRVAVVVIRRKDSSLTGLNSFISMLASEMAEVVWQTVAINLPLLIRSTHTLDL